MTFERKRWVLIFIILFLLVFSIPIAFALDFNDLSNWFLKIFGLKKEGKVVSVSAIEQCVDSDSGKDHYTPGKVTKDNIEYTDYCGAGTANGQYIFEQYCENNLLKTDTFVCPAGCTLINGLGKCISETAPCTDSDSGKDHYTPGKVTKDNIEYTDYCGAGTANGQYIFEQYCENNLLKTDTFVCPAECEWSRNASIYASACVNVSEPCTDSDGGIFFSKKGYVTKGEVVHDDYCGSGGSKVVEGYCDANGKIVQQVMSCSCSDGVCSVDDSILCTDSDGGIDYYIKGRATKFGSLEDMCRLDGVLLEAVCNRNLNYPEYFATNCTNGCFDGKCTNVSESCTDSDGGIDYNRLGVVTKGNSTYKDFCGNMVAWDQRQYIAEKYCDSSGNVKEDIGICNNGCSNGVCIGAPAPVCGDGKCESPETSSSCPVDCKPIVCNDSDGGLNYYTAGWITKGDILYKDFCGLGSNLFEYYCDTNSNITTELFFCQHGCTTLDGAARCVKEAEPCTDSDGGDYYTPGFVTKGGVVERDFCVTGDTLFEQYCANESVEEEIVDCSNGCITINGSGKCVKEAEPCTDSDGKDYYKGGVVTKGDLTLKDSCVSSNLLEYYCDNTSSIRSETVSCSAGCIIEDSRGLCVNETLPCTDSDGGLNYYTFGKVSKGGYFIADVCGTFNNLFETYCDFNGRVATFRYECPYGCGNNSCINQTILCEDSDGGLNYLVPGQVTKGNYIVKDYCGLGNILSETSCDELNRVKTSQYVCPDGCALIGGRGACLEKESETCSDSDNGINYYFKGKATKGPTVKEDYCGIGNTLFEQYCNSNGTLIENSIFFCPNGCKGGACLIDLAVSITDVMNVSDLDLTYFKGLKVGSREKGYIDYGENTINLLKEDLTPINFSEFIKFEQNKVTVNSEVFESLNKSATITVENVLDVSNPIIMSNGVICEECKIVSFSNGTLVFTVPHFSEYIIGEGSFCGDGYCSSKETALTCSRDCMTYRPTKEAGLTLIITSVLVALILVIILNKFAKKKNRKGKFKHRTLNKFIYD